jgi:hypothetical protein
MPRSGTNFDNSGESPVLVVEQAAAGTVVHDKDRHRRIGGEVGI